MWAIGGAIPRCVQANPAIPAMGGFQRSGSDFQPPYFPPPFPQQADMFPQVQTVP